jgi:hypothetical protein
MIDKLKKIISLATVLIMTLSIVSSINVSAAETEIYPYALFADSDISLTGDSINVNGNIHANYSIGYNAGNVNINGTSSSISITSSINGNCNIRNEVKNALTENIIYIPKKIKNQYFYNAQIYDESYVLNDMNVNISNNIYTTSNMQITGNTNLNGCIAADEGIELKGQNFNANNAVVFSQYGDININSIDNVNINGLLYAPNGTITINSGSNVQINGAILADTIIINGSNVTFNTNNSVAQFIGTQSDAKEKLVNSSLVKDDYCLFADSAMNLSFKTGDIKGSLYSNSQVTVCSNEDISGHIINKQDGKSKYLTNFSEILMNKESDRLDDTIGTSGLDKAVFDKPIFNEDDIDFKCNKLELNNLFAANNYINIDSTDILCPSDESVIFSSNGDITINMSDAEINGLIYAPGGCVHINGDNLKLNGMIIASSISIDVDKCNLSSNEELIKKYDLEEYSKDDIVDAIEEIKTLENQGLYILKIRIKKLYLTITRGRI